MAWDEDRPLEGALSVDGVVPGSGLNLSHWPGNRTPRHLKADTSTEIVLKALEDAETRAAMAAAGVVTNNHYDTDGVLSIALALDRSRWTGLEQLFVDAARAGDLDLHGGEQAVILDLILTGLGESEESPLRAALEGLSRPHRLQRLVDEAILRLPEIVANPRAYLGLWEEELDDIRQSMDAFHTGRARCASHVPHADATLVLSDRFLHPLSVWSHAQASRVLIATEVEDGHTFEFRYGVSSWFDLPEPRPARRDLRPLLEALARLEPSEAGSWTQVGELDDLSPGAAFLDDDDDLVPSGLDPLAVFQAAAWHLRATDVARAR